jgi:hypothetical protein
MQQTTCCQSSAQIKQQLPDTEIAKLVLLHTIALQHSTQQQPASSRALTKSPTAMPFPILNPIAVQWQKQPSPPNPIPGISPVSI